MNIDVGKDFSSSSKSALTIDQQEMRMRRKSHNKVEKNLNTNL